MALISYRHNKGEAGSILKYTKKFPNITTRKAKNLAELCNIPVKTRVCEHSHFWKLGLFTGDSLEVMPKGSMLSVSRGEENTSGSKAWL